MNASRKPRRGSEPAADSEEANRLKVLGGVIRSGRVKIRASRGHGAINQAGFYKLCRNLESPDPKRRAEVCFPSASPDSQRRFISEVEAGKHRLLPEHNRIIEKVCGWPSGVLDEAFGSTEEFEALCAAQSSVKLDTAPSEPASLGSAKGEPWSHPRGDHERQLSGPEGRRGRKNVDLRGLRTLRADHEPLASRAHLAVDVQEALRPSSQEPLRIVAIHGEAGIGKSQLIAEWWRDHGRKRFKQITFTLDCARLGGDMILELINGFFLERPSSELTTALTDRINECDNVLIVLDGLSDEEGDPALAAGPDVRISLRHGQDVLAASGRADRTALRRVREILIFLGSHDVRASILLGIQTAEQTEDPLKIEQRLNASSHLMLFRVGRLASSEGAKLMQDRGVRHLSFSDLEHLSDRLEGLPISLAAAAHYLRAATPDQAEAFLSEINRRGRAFSFFEEFFGRYLEALNHGAFDENAHPQAYLRLLALMPGPVTKSQIDELLVGGRITRLEKASTAKFSRMRIDFVINTKSHIDINPMVRGLLRQELARVVDRGGERASTSREELHWIHATAARWCLARLPKDPADFSTVEIEMIEGALYHLLSLRDYLNADQTDETWRPAAFDDVGGLLDGRSNAEVITQYCLDNIVRRFLLDRIHRATRFLGQFETKARLLSLFFESLDNNGRPKHLKLWDQATIYGEMGICWMHAGRLQLAKEALDQAAFCLRGLGAERKRFEPLLPPPEGERDLWRLWTDTQATQALIFMRLGRKRDDVEDILSDAVAIAQSVARRALNSESEIEPRQAALLRSARRVLCRKAQVSLNGGEVAEAEAGYQMAADVERRIGGKKLTGDAMRRQIEVLVLRGPCLAQDIAIAESLIDAQLERGAPGVRRRLSNDIIPMFATKVMLLRAKGEFIAARNLLREAMNHEFVLRGECSFTARMELALEEYRLLIATNAVTSESQRSLRLMAQELEARHHQILYWDAMLLLAETLAEPERSEVLATAERQFTFSKWLRRRTDINILREGGSAVKALAC